MTEVGGTPHKRLVTDGVVHLAYFNSPYSFVWTGRFADPIEVEWGGYGEPIQYLIHGHLDGDLARSYQRHVTEMGMSQFDWYAMVCDQWLSDSDAPVEVTESWDNGRGE